MITIVFSDESIRITGHAEYAEHGQDIVCAGVSVASQMLKVMLNGGGYKSPGDMLIKYKDSHEAMRMVSGYQLTMLLLEKQYPENIKVVIE